MGRLLGFNPVEAALESDRRTVERVWIQKGRAPGKVSRLRTLARKRGVPVEMVDRIRLERLAGGKPRSAHQGVVASVAPIGYEDAKSLLERCGPVARLLVLDGVEDPRNLGALLRTAAAAGVDGVFLPRRRAAGLSETTAKAAAGALEKVPVARVGNLAEFINTLKNNDFWTTGLDASAETPWDGIRYPARLALIVGGEGRGLRRLVRDRCDAIVSIPLFRGVESLNVSVAAGICLFEVLRQDRARKSGPTPFT